MAWHDDHSSQNLVCPSLLLQPITYFFMSFASLSQGKKFKHFIPEEINDMGISVMWSLQFKSKMSRDTCLEVRRDRICWSFSAFPPIIIIFMSSGERDREMSVCVDHSRYAKLPTRLKLTTRLEQKGKWNEWYTLIMSLYDNKCSLY